MTLAFLAKTQVLRLKVFDYSLLSQLFFVLTNFPSFQA